MKDLETEITYGVEYQDKSDSTWWVFTNHQYKHAVKSGLHSDTTDLGEAQKAAQDLLTGRQYTTNHVTYRKHVVATRIIQRISMGGVLMTFGDEQPEG